MKPEVRYEYYHWVTREARRILEALGYDTDGEKTVNEQFLEKHKEQLVGTKKRIYGKRNKTTKNQK